MWPKMMARIEVKAHEKSPAMPHTIAEMARPLLEATGRGLYWVCGW